MIRTLMVLAGVVGLIGSAEFVGTGREPVRATTRRNGAVPFRVGERNTYQAKSTAFKLQMKAESPRRCGEPSMI